MNVIQWHYWQNKLAEKQDGYRRIPEIEPTELHQRVPFFCGSAAMVTKAEEFMAKALKPLEIILLKIGNYFRGCIFKFIKIKILTFCAFSFCTWFSIQFF